MILLVLFAFLAGVVTILSPCILPVLPIVLSSSATGGKRRPLGIVTGFIASFTFFTLALSSIVRATGLPSQLLRTISVVIIFAVGVSLLWPTLQFLTERLLAKLIRTAPGNTRGSGFWSGIVVGMSLGLIWTPCVGPILASVISLAITGSVNGNAILMTFSYALGTSIPMFAIMHGGRQLLTKTPWLSKNTHMIQKGFGIIMILTAITLLSNADRTFQIWVLRAFPNYSALFTKLEDSVITKQKLNKDIGEQAPQFIAGGEWINSKPLTLKELRGNVVLVDFWTYTCINCIRTLPYLQAWHEKYKDKGLVIVGVHTPEFEFEKKSDNVKKAVFDFGLTYPIMQDNDYATWQAYKNRYWPAKYLIDIHGNIRYTHFGEGDYDKTEQAIQELLSEAGTSVSDMTIANPTYQVQAKTPESYLGYRRIESLVSPEQIERDKKMQFTIPRNIPPHGFAYQGTWTIGPERAMPYKDSTLVFHFDAKDVYLVMRPKDVKEVGKVKVFLDDQKVGEGEIIVDTDRLYTLINLPKPGSHILKLEFLDNNLELYAFTFG